MGYDEAKRTRCRPYPQLQRCRVETRCEIRSRSCRCVSIRVRAVSGVILAFKRQSCRLRRVSGDTNAIDGVRQMVISQDSLYVVSFHHKIICASSPSVPASTDSALCSTFALSRTAVHGGMPVNLLPNSNDGIDTRSLSFSWRVYRSLACICESMSL